MKELLRRNDRERHKALLEENDKLLNNKREQNETILELSNKIINSRVQFYLSPKITLWKFMITVGKSWLFILCIFLVLLTQLFDFLLSIGSTVLVNMSILSIVSAIILKFIDIKLSCYNKGVEYWFYKKSFKHIKNIIRYSEKEYCDEIISKIKANVKAFEKLPD